jgi:hypothetical protein
MKSKHLAVLLSTMGALIAMLGLTASAATAKPPSAGYGDFAGCPSPDENPFIEGCLVTIIDSGHFKMGSKNVPITNPIRLAGGISGVDGSFHYNSEGGLSASKQQVPGGIIGLTGLDWLVNFLSLEGLKLYAVTELAGTPGNPFGEDPFKLPIKVHLINPVLGSKCYVGSNSNPINLNLTLGTTSPPPPNTPISGTSPKVFLDPARPGVVIAENGTYVDNSFAAPGANGCTLTLFGFIPISINGLVNSQSGLPAPAGTNTTVQNFDGKLGFPEAVFHP